MIGHRNFKDWNTDDVAKTFGLSHTSACALLSEWADSRHSVPDELRGWLENRRTELFRLQFAWNEQELMARFIGPLLTSIDFLGSNYNLFLQRTLSIKFQARKTSGLVDGMVATGIFVPQHPFFFLQEYQKSQGYDSDPFGQLLVAMVAAQHLNNDGQPLFGCYVIGKIWTFVLLDGQQYATTQSYDATDAGELQIIWSMLVEVKHIVEERVEQLLAQAE